MSGMNVVAHNMLSMFSSRQLGITNKTLAKSTEKLSSGYKINRSADDASGLAISEKMRKAIRGLSQGSRNVQDGISLCQTGDGYLEEVHSMLQRINELAIKSANGTNSNADRQNIDEEVQQVKAEMRRIFKTAKFNETKLFSIPYAPDPEILAHTRNVAVQTSTQLPNGVTMDSASANAGYMASTYTSASGVTYNAATRFDFSGVNLSNLSSMDGLGFWSTCCTCDDHYSITFDSTTDQNSVSGSQHYTYTVGTMGCTSVQDLVKRIVDATGGQPNGHFTNYMVDPGDSTGKTLLIYDNRPNQKASSSRGLVGTGVTVERQEKPGTMDIQVFNEGFNSNGSILYGGVEINDVRHTWDELGINISSDGMYFTDNQEIEFYDYRNERVHLKVKAGDSLPNVTRNYTWEAKTDGIYVNNVLATTWDDLGFDGEEYSFIFRGMKISFSVNEGDTFQDIPEGINSGNLNRHYSWDIDVGYINSQKAVYAEEPISIQITNSNKSKTKLNYYVIADDNNGVSVKDSSNGNHPFIAWKDLKNVGSKISGDFPISDWGLSDIDGEGTSSDEITFDDEAIYSYTDSSSDFQIGFNFSIADEASRDAVIAGLDGAQLIAGTISAPGSASVTSTNIASGTAPTVKVTTNRMNNFKLQEAYGRDFDNPNWTQTGQIVRTLISDANTNTGYFQYTGTFAGETITTVNGNKFSLSDTSKTFTDNVEINTASGNPFRLSFQNSASSTATSTTNFTYKASGYATISYSLDTNTKNNDCDSPVFNDVTVNVPERKLWIQSGAEAGHGIWLSWNALSNASIGISPVNMLTQESSTAAIGFTKKAIEIISETRSQFGSYQNRLEHTFKNNNNTIENTEAAESLIRDTDIASEMVIFSKNKILQQAGQSMLSQANHLPEGIISLLQ